MRTLADEGNKRAARVLAVTDNSSKMLSAVLIGNNIVNLTASSISTSLALKLFGSVGVGIATGILTLLILIFGEISPKNLATLYADKLAMTYSGVIAFLMTILTPVIYIVNALSFLLLKLFRIDPDSAAKQMTEKELRTIVDVGHENGIIESEEHEIINNVFDFNDAQAKEIMVPRIDMTMVEVNCSYDDLLAIFRECQYTRLPVYEENTDNIIGILNMKDLLIQDSSEGFSLRNYLREPYFTYEHKNTADLFIEMRKSSISMAIVLDEYGASAGLVTLEDLLEEIVGEIRDEYDTDEVDDITPLGDQEFMVLGSANINDVNDALDVKFSSDDYDTLGGFCLGKLNHLPEKNEVILTEDNILLRIEKVDKNRIEKIYIKLPEKPRQD